MSSIELSCNYLLSYPYGMASVTLPTPTAVAIELRSHELIWKANDVEMDRSGLPGRDRVDGG